jgi:hypothetical protein
MQQKFQQDKILSKYFDKYEIYGNNYKGHYKIGRREFDFLLQHKTEKNKFKIIELKKDEKGCGVFGQILMYVCLLEEYISKNKICAWEEAEISIEIIANGIASGLMDAVLASGSKGSKIKVKYIEEKKFTKREDTIKEISGNDYDSIEYVPKKEKNRIIKLKNENKLLVVWYENTRKEGAGFYSFDKLLSYIYKYRKEAIEISGIIICKEPDSKEQRENQEKLPLTIRGNEIMKEKKIEVGFWEYKYDEKELNIKKTWNNLSPQSPN